MGFRFHATAPAGQWLNDPNALVYEAGRYRLYAQHCPQAGFGAMGWGRLSSSDLLTWQWDGVAFAPTATHSVFSGSMLRTPDATLEVFYTLHERAQGHETQHRNRGIAGLAAGAPIGPAGRNCRDPFVFFWPATGDWRMLVAHPCDKTDWAAAPASHLSVWASADRQTWTEAGRIGPWHSGGVQWEVPVMVDFGAVQALIVSLVDLRQGGRACSARWWLGRFDGSGFVPDSAGAAEGERLDIGPDFYAAIPNVAGGWPGDERVVIAWASNWETAKSMPWPDGVHGGPLTLPRCIELHAGRLRQQPPAAALALAARQERWTPGQTLLLPVAGNGAQLDLVIAADGTISAKRHSSRPELRWTSPAQLRLQAATDITLFIDAGLVEIFFGDDGRVLTAFVPGAKADPDNALSALPASAPPTQSPPAT